MSTSSAGQSAIANLPSKTWHWSLSSCVRSGANGGVIHLLRGLAAGDRAGASLAAVGDVEAAEIYDLRERVAEFLTTDVARAVLDLNRAPDDRRPDGVDYAIFMGSGYGGTGEGTTFSIVLPLRRENTA